MLREIQKPVPLQTLDHLLCVKGEGEAQFDSPLLGVYGSQIQNMPNS